MPIDSTALLQRLVASSVEDADLTALLHRSVGAVRLAFDKAAAHLTAPAGFPLPDAPRSLERVFTERLQRLAPASSQALSAAARGRLGASPEARAAAYGDAGGLDPALAEPVMLQAARAPLTVPLQQAATRLRARLDARAREIAAAKPDAPGAATTLAPSELQLVVHKVRCVEHTHEGSRDDISFAAVATDVFAGTEATLAPTFIGHFRAGDEQAFDPPMPVHGFGLAQGGLLDAFYQSTLFLAEIDLGGFKAYVDAHGAVSDHELHELAVIATAAQVAGDIGLAVGGLLGLALGAGSGIGAVLFGLVGAQLGEIVLGAVAAVAALLVVTAIDAVAGVLKDDVFPPTLVQARLDPDGSLSGGRSASGVLVAPFQLGKGSYEVDYEWRVLLGPPVAASPEAPSPPATEAASAAEALANLQKVKHVVVLMLENRSFDHMLGYLKLEAGRADVDGLTADMHNAEHARDASGGFSGPVVADFPVAPLPGTSFDLDPDHDEAHVKIQVGAARDMSGFVDDFSQVSPSSPGLVMGFHTADHVPAYDLVADEFGLCDRWFSSFPGSTWVNRTIAIAGRPAKRKDGTFIAATNTAPVEAGLEEPSFFRLLQDWKVYAEDAPSPLLVDFSLHTQRARFRGIDDFFDDAANGTLPAVAWIDPNFVDIGPLPQQEDTPPGDRFPTTANDDHPPTDVAHAQVLVAAVLFALLHGPAWRDTLFVVLYDEHGGFFDHVPPPDLPVPPESPEFATLGVRVPALVVSPWVGRRLVSHRQLDHTSLIKTILLRFCAAGGVPSMSARVDAADHLGWLLNEAEPRFVASGLPVLPRGVPAPPRPAGALSPAHRALLPRLGRLMIAALARPAVARPPSDLQKQFLDAQAKLAAQGFASIPPSG